MTESLVDRLGLQVYVQFVLNQFPRNSRHVSRLPCENVPIFLEEFDEREFLFGIQTIAYMSDLGRLLCGQRNGFAERVLRLDGRLGLGHDWVRGEGGGLGQGLLQVLGYANDVSPSAVLQLSLS
jgi:hypothetical protein